jgi:hypothetical protein
MTTRAVFMQGKTMASGYIRRLLGLAAPNARGQHSETETGLLAALRRHGYAPSAVDPYVWVPCRAAAAPGYARTERR